MTPFPLPQNLDAERFILGSVLLQGTEFFERIRSSIASKDFSIQKHRLIFSAVKSLHGRHEMLDRVTVANELMREGNLEAVDGVSYLCSLDDGLPMIPNLDSYVKIIRNKAMLREIAYASQSAMNRAMQAEEDPEEIIASVQSALEGINRGDEAASFARSTEVIQRYPGGFGAFISPSQNTDGTVTFPWSKVQELTCGLREGDLAVLAGRPSMGKSAAALQIALTNAQRGMSVAYFSLEMTSAALIRRLLAMISRVDSQKSRSGYLNADERAKLIRAREHLENLKIWILDKGGRTAPAIASALRSLRRERPVDLAIIDHFHLVRSDSSERDERIRYNRIADDFQREARDTGIPFIVLAQLSRKCEEEGRAPGLSDLKETGKLEENSDLVMFVHRPEMYAKFRSRKDLRGISELIIAKQRDGAVGKQNLTFLGNIHKFENMAEDIPEPDNQGRLV